MHTHSDDQILSAALRRYARDSRADCRCVYQEPCSASSEVTGDTVTLRNVNGALARFRRSIDAAGRVRLKKREE